jgi:DNA-binding NtrC family response regulator
VPETPSTSALERLRPWLTGSSPALAALAADLVRLAGSEVTVVLQGESGSGKNEAARALHGLSPRASGPLVEVDLAALAPTLLEAELFGHVAGAFTGAARARTGRFLAAQGGTLVLDGVELLPEALQAKLLRVLQERRVQPVGSEDELAIDVRVLATTSADLRERAEAGRFRPDLYWRLAVAVLRVPPLRERLEDLPVLAAVLTERVAARAGLPPRALSEGALHRLASHPWPGNVRELENALERVHALAPGGAGPIEAAELGFLAESLEGVRERLAEEALAHGVTAAELEEAMLARAVEEARGNKSAAARRLGLTRRALESRLKRLEEGREGKA